ncbi:hypothetical protein ACFQ07_32925 [Actinomadura adrarensis]|uniref:Protein kilB n=1 Tax=Actinomadura adrarensis TaxID=1819600 RepID=A0ABW3CTZ5_9ACTN
MVAVTGTLLGALLTFLFQRRNADRTERLTRERERREERLAAFGAFAGAVVDFRRAEYDRVHRRLDEPDSAAHDEARTESYRVRAVAHQEFFRVRLLCGDAELAQLAARALELTESIHDAETKEQVGESGERAKQALDEFIDAASGVVRT